VFVVCVRVEKMEDTHKLNSSAHSTTQELDIIVRDIIGAEIFDAHNANNSLNSEHQEQASRSVANSAREQPMKKTRQHSPSRKAPFNALDQLLSHNHSNSSIDLSSQREDKALEKALWNSASMLSNSRPSPSFVIRKEDKQLREERATHSCAPLKSMPEEDQEGDGGERPPLFEGSVANSTPGDIIDGGGGSGTAQHLACLLDSPLALAMLIALGVKVEARHTAFRRLPIHEAACADSPLCLSLLMGVGTRFSLEVMQGLSSSSSFMSAASTHEAESSCSSDCSERSNLMEGCAENKKQQKKKLNIFSGWKKSSEPSSPRSAQGKKGPGLIPFPLALKIIWDTIQHLRSGEISELDAAHSILDQVRVTRRTKALLAMQCSTLASKSEHGDDKISPLSSSLPLLPGLRGVNQLFLPVQTIQSLAFHKCNVDGHGNTPLHWAAFKNSVRAIDVLLSHGVDVNCPAQPSGWTPLHDAAYSNAGDAVARLIAAGATVDARSHSGATPLCFAAQEDSPDAIRILLEAGADPSLRCLGNSPGTHIRANNADNNHFHSRFSGYTPLHYCAHYNAAKAARVLLHGNRGQHGHKTANLLEIPDLNDKLPIHVAVARGSSEVLRELLHGGARVETASSHSPTSPMSRVAAARLLTLVSVPVAIPTRNDADVENSAHSTSPAVVTPVSSPVLRAMIPAQPITSSKPWNCLSQKSIDACKHLINEAEMNWTPERHSLFSPSDRNAIVEVLRVGKRLEQSGQGIFLDLWPNILAFCGRGWFEVVKDGDEMSMQCSSSGELSEEDMEMTQFFLDGITIGR